MGTLARLTCLLALLATPATAAEFKVSADGASITMSGYINREDAAAFALALDKAKPGAMLVLTESTGGSTSEARKIGKIVHDRQIRTHVPARAECYSGCALVWLAGAPRSAARKALIGFHGPYDPKTLKPAPKGREAVTRYISELGLDARVTAMALGGAPDRLVMLTPKRATAIGLPVDFTSR